MADEKIGEAAAATAAEGGAVVLIPNAEAEAAEHNDTPAPVLPLEPAPVEVVPPEPAPSVVETPALEARIALAEQQLVDHGARLEILTTQFNTARDGDAARWDGHLAGHVATDHEHPIPEDVRIVAEELRAISDEERAPERARVRRGWLRRALRGER